MGDLEYMDDPPSKKITRIHVGRPFHPAKSSFSFIPGSDGPAQDNIQVLRI